MKPSPSMRNYGERSKDNGGGIMQLMGTVVNYEKRMGEKGKNGMKEETNQFK